VINGVVSLWKTDSMDQDNLIYVLGSLEDHGHNIKDLTKCSEEIKIKKSSFSSSKWASFVTFSPVR
jgi:hypothetical protein